MKKTPVLSGNRQGVQERTESGGPVAGCLSIRGLRGRGDQGGKSKDTASIRQELERLFRIGLAGVVANAPRASTGCSG